MHTISLTSDLEPKIRWGPLVRVNAQATKQQQQKKTKWNEKSLERGG